ncbi:MAG: rhamnan synthesis F family protein [Microbacteriaceae bacterium]
MSRLVRGRVRRESGPTALPAGTRRAAVVVHYSETARLSLSVRTLVEQLRAGGYPMVLVSSCEAGEPLDWGGPPPEDVTVLRKPNLGYDFGSAAVGLDALPGLRELDCVLVVNDSNLGPFAPLAPFLERFEASTADVWGLTSSVQTDYHLQSFFLGFRRGVLAEPPLRRFWADIRHHRDKNDVILRYEIGLSRLLVAEGYAIEAEFPAAAHTSPLRVNPVAGLWRELLDAGYPFVKRELVTRPWVEPSSAVIPAAIRHRFGQDAAAWL